MNKTKKYTIIFVVVCFLIIGGFSVYHAFFTTPKQTNAVALNENQTQQQEETSPKEDSTENQSSKVNQSTDDTDIADNSSTQKQNQQSSQASSTKQSSSQQSSSSQSQSSSTDETQTTQEVEEEETEEPTETVESVYVTITGIDSVIASDYIEFDEGMSAYDALKILTDNYEISLKSSGSGQTVYVKAINGLSEFDYGGMSGWKYRVNGTYPSVGAGSYTLKSGDQLEWIYSQNG